MLKAGKFFGSFANANGFKLLSRSIAGHGPPAPSKPFKEEANELFRASDSPSTAPRRYGFSLNRVEIVGGLASDPTLLTAKTGNEYVSFQVITDRKRPDGTPLTESHTVVAFRGRDRIMRTLRRGKRVYVEGRIGYSRLTLPDGTIVQRASIIAENLAPVQAFRRNDLDAETDFDDSKDETKI